MMRCHKSLQNLSTLSTIDIFTITMSILVTASIPAYDQQQQCDLKMGHKWTKFTNFSGYSILLMGPKRNRMAWLSGQRLFALLQGPRFESNLANILRGIGGSRKSNPLGQVGTPVKLSLKGGS